MSIYAGLASTASNLIAKFGKSITISREVSEAYNPATGVITGASTESQTIDAVVLPASGGKTQALDLRYKLGSMEYQRLGYFQVSGADLIFNPEPGHTVLIGGETWIVLGVTPLNPNDGSPIIYEVAIRI